MGKNDSFVPAKMSELYSVITAVLLFTSLQISAQSFDIPSSRWGLSFGNSEKFNGLRINWRDKNVEQINGINITLWIADSNRTATVNGLSLGLVMPEAAYLKGIQIGGLGVAAKKGITGITVGLLGAGSGGKITGLTFGGLGVGSGGGINGLAIGGLGVGSGGNLRGVALGGLGIGSGGQVTGVMLGGLGVGAGGDVTGLLFGGLGVGSGGDMTGIQVGGLAVGAGGEITGLSIGGLGVGSGEQMRGIAIGGIGVGAPRISGLAIGGIGVGGKEIKGVALAAGFIRIADHGYFKGLSAGAFSYIKGRQNGLSIAIVNYAEELNGVQLGLINIAKNNPDFFRILPVMNLHFD